MILIGRYASPFARRVGVTLNLLGVPFEHRPWSVWDDAESIKDFNPLRRVPTLVLDDGTTLVEALVIMDVLDDLVGPERALLPRTGPLRRDGLRLCGLIGGLSDKAVSLLYERLFRDEPSVKWTSRCQTQILETLDLLEQDLAARATDYWLGAAPSHPDIALTCTWRFVQEAHPGLLAAERWPCLRQLAARCEALPAFAAAVMPFVTPVFKETLADHDLELFIVDKNDTSWSMRPWLLLAHHGIPFKETSFVAADPETPTQIKRVSPTGKVPALRIGKELLWESLAIIETLAELYPRLPIWPRSPSARRHARAIAAEMHAGFSELRRHCSMNIVLRTRIELDPARRRELDRFERMIEDARNETTTHGAAGPFLFGEFCAADAMLAPVATRIRSYGLDVGPVTRAWMDAVFALPAFQRWEREAIEEASTRPAARTIGVPHDGPVASRIPDAPCYAVIFSNQRAPGERDYASVAEQMVELAKQAPGYLGHESVRGADGFGITVSYWSSMDDIANFRALAPHREAQQAGRQHYYQSYDLRVARLEKHVKFRTHSP